ncbi:MAG: 3-keto-5-aminohexanoate cleavage protein [Verrucomicrobia bacterium]|nr:3-keto-5-aminohexanoate cleavage protein [Verrucomicrobiota bacterium]
MKVEPLIINAALTGIVPTREMTPHVPLTAVEVAADAERVVRAGASMVHLHAREPDGEASSRPELYREIILRVREKCADTVVVVTTSGRRVKDHGERLEVLGLNGDAKPDMASLTLGSLNFANESSANPPAVIERLLGRMNETGIRPELEIFDSGMANYAAHLIRKGLLARPLYANILLGSLGTAPATLKHLVNLVDDLPEGVTWAATGIGQFAFPVQSWAITMGGHNVSWPGGSLPRSQRASCTAGQPRRMRSPTVRVSFAASCGSRTSSLRRSSTALAAALRVTS